MRNAITIKSDRGRVAVYSGARLLSDHSPGEADELAGALRTAAKSPLEGWLYQDGRLKVGCGRDRVVVLVDGRAVLDVPQQAAKRVGDALLQHVRIAQHWERLSDSQSRERLYDDQQKLIAGGLPQVNLGVPGPELRAMGGISSREGVGLPILKGHPPKKAHSNGDHRDSDA